MQRAATLATIAARSFASLEKAGRPDYETGAAQSIPTCNFHPSLDCRQVSLLAIVHRLMSYGTDLANAARRHLEAATLLDRSGPQGRRDVAGYLYGIAGECALKEIMRRSGMVPKPDKSNDPFYLHFPGLKTALRDAAAGRLQSQLLQYASDSSLMREWDVKMRYAHSSDVLGQPIDLWAEQARKIRDDMEAL